MMEEEQGLNNESRGRVNFLREMIIIDFSYILTSWLGRVKLLQFVFVTLAGIITPGIVNTLFSRYAFFVFIVWTSFIYIVLDLLLHLTSLWRRLPQLMTSPAVLIFPLSIGVLAFLIGSSVIAAAAHVHSGSRATTSGLGAFCGFVVMVLYGVEIFLHLRSMNSEGTTAEAPQVNPARNRPISGPVTVDIVSTEPPPYNETKNASGGVYVATTY